jgi:hypothetical protein
VARKARPPGEHHDKRHDNLLPVRPFTSTHQPAPERRSGGPRPITRWLRENFKDPKELEAFGRAVLKLAKGGHSVALSVVVDRTDDALTQRHAVAVADLSGVDDATLDKLEAILEPISPRLLPDA